VRSTPHTVVGLTSEDHGIADDQALRALIYQCLFLGTRLNASEFELSSPPPIPLTVTRGDSLENGNYWTFDERELSLDYLLPDDDAQGVAGLQEVQWPSWRAEKTAPGGPPSAYFPSPSSYFPSPRGTSQGGLTRSTTIGGFTRGTSQGLNRVSVVTRGVREAQTYLTTEDLDECEIQKQPTGAADPKVSSCFPFLCLWRAWLLEKCLISMSR